MKTVKRSVKHVFTPEETASLNIDFGRSFDSLLAAEAELKMVTGTYKAKVTEAQSRMTTLRATVNAGFEMREKEVVLLFDVKSGKKFFFLKSDFTEDENLTIEELKGLGVEPVITEAMTQDDYQAELIQAESDFNDRKEIQLFPATEKDSGILVIGEQGGKWFSALRVKIGGREIKERLDSEQSCSKVRSAQVDRSLKRFIDWVKENLGAEEAKGFKNHVELVKAEQAEKVE